MRMVLLAAVAVVVLCAASTVAQEEQETILRKHVISTNPILDVFTWYNLEWEMSITQRGTIGLFGSYVTLTDTEDEIDIDTKYISGTLFYRYYPTAAFKGFFIGGRFGYYHVSEDDDIQETSGEFMGIGVDVGYGWLLGAPQRVAIGIGIGAVRLFGGDLEDVQTTLPSIRFINVGIAF
jgi:hypothetical protein